MPVQHDNGKVNGRRVCLKDNLVLEERSCAMCGGSFEIRTTRAFHVAKYCGTKCWRMSIRHHPDWPCKARGEPRGESKYATAHCRTCKRKNAARWEEATFGSRINASRYYMYGITPEQIDALFKKQDGKCAICEDDISEKFCVDHNHRTEKPRGLLCKPCNSALGQFKDNPNILRRGIAYLEEYGNYGLPAHADDSEIHVSEVRQ